MIFARTINKIPEFYVIFARKVPELYTISARKIFFRIFFLGGGTVHVPPISPPSSPVSYAYAHKRFSGSIPGLAGF